MSYCFVITVEKCKYSCGYMNPAVVLSSHIVGENDENKNVFSFERIFEAVRKKRIGCTRTAWFWDR